MGEHIHTYEHVHEREAFINCLIELFHHIVISAPAKCPLWHKYVIGFEKTTTKFHYYTMLMKLLQNGRQVIFFFKNRNSAENATAERPKEHEDVEQM